MSIAVPDFDAAEQALVARLVERRYGKAVAVELADSELKLDPARDELTLCPTLYWCERGAHFVIWKVGPQRYRCQFFYTDADHYGTGRDEYADLEQCALTLLRVQADHEKQAAGIASGATASDLANDDYLGPPSL